MRGRAARWRRPEARLCSFVEVEVAGGRGDGPSWRGGAPQARGRRGRAVPVGGGDLARGRTKAQSGGRRSSCGAGGRRRNRAAPWTWRWPEGEGADLVGGERRCAAGHRPERTRGPGRRRRSGAREAGGAVERPKKQLRGGRTARRRRVQPSALGLGAPHRVHERVGNGGWNGCRRIYTGYSAGNFHGT